MIGLYTRWIDRWERKLATRDTNRMVRDFEWGLDWLSQMGVPACPASANGDSPAHLEQFIHNCLTDSGTVFSYPPPSDFRLSGNHLTFTSPVVSPYPENNRVHARFFRAPND